MPKKKGDDHMNERKHSSIIESKDQPWDNSVSKSIQIEEEEDQDQ